MGWSLGTVQYQSANSETLSHLYAETCRPKLMSGGTLLTGCLAFDLISGLTRTIVLIDVFLLALGLVFLKLFQVSVMYVWSLEYTYSTCAKY